MAHIVCPWWLGYFLVSPIRRLRENPEKMLGEWVRPGMVVLEPGCGMGFFTLPLARMVVPGGRVVAVDVQERMLGGLRRRAAKAGLAGRIEARLAGPTSLGIADLAGTVDLCVAIHMVHEVPDPAAFFAELAGALKPAGRVLLIEPKGHVSETDFTQTLAAATGAGLGVVQRPLPACPRSALLGRSG